MGVERSGTRLELARDAFAALEDGDVVGTCVIVADLHLRRRGIRGQRQQDC
jgi:hypothetical protein